MTVSVPINDSSLHVDEGKIPVSEYAKREELVPTVEHCPGQSGRTVRTITGATTDFEITDVEMCKIQSILRRITSAPTDNQDVCSWKDLLSGCKVSEGPPARLEHCPGQMSGIKPLLFSGVDLLASTTYLLRGEPPKP